MQTQVMEHQIDDNASKGLKLQVQQQNQRKKVQIEANKRYQKLLHLEEQNDFLHQSLSEKTKLVKSKKEIEILLEVRKERNQLFENFLAQKTNSKQASEQCKQLKEKVMNI